MHMMKQSSELATTASRTCQQRLPSCLRTKLTSNIIYPQLNSPPRTITPRLNPCLQTTPQHVCMRALLASWFSLAPTRNGWQLRTHKVCHRMTSAPLSRTVCILLDEQQTHMAHGSCYHSFMVKANSLGQETQCSRASIVRLSIPASTINSHDH